MTTVSMDLVKKLREKTQVGMMACKEALEEASGDIEKAIELLRKQGANVAIKRADHAANNGRIEAFIASDYKSGALAEVNCETDFSANTNDVKQFAVQAAELATASQAPDVTALESKQPSIKESLDELAAKIGERILLNKVSYFSVDGHGIVNTYIHPGSSIGILIQIDTEQDPATHLEDLKFVSRDICMQIAVNNPLSISPDGLDKNTGSKRTRNSR